MEDRGKQIYATLGGALFGLSLGIFGNWLQPGSMTWVMVAAITGVAGLLIICGSAFRWPLPGLNSHRALLSKESCNLSEDILHWLDSRNDAQPNFTESDWDDLNGPAMAFHNGTVARWQARYGTKALALHDKLLKAGAPPAREVPRERFEFPANELGIKAISHALVEMSCSLESRSRPRKA